MSAKSVAPLLQLLLVLLTVGAFNGCGSSSSQPPPQSAITLSVTSSLTSVSAGQTTTLTATTNDPKGVTWTLTPTTGAGSLSDPTATTVKYNAPATISSAFSATVTATSVSDPAKSQSMKISVKGPALSPLAISTNLPAAVFTVPYSGTVTASGGVPPYTIAMTGTLPAGLSYSNGVVSGTPTYPGNGGGPFSFTAADSAAPPNTAQTGNLSIQVNLPTSLTVLTSSLPNTDVGSSYNQALFVTGGIPPYTYSISSGSLPPGITLNNSPAIAGTPTTAGVYNFTFKVADFAIPPNVATASLSVTVNPALRITTTILPGGAVSAPYSAPPLQATGGAPPYTFSVYAPTELPLGLSVGPTNGQIGGLPQTAGTDAVEFAVVDSLGGIATANLSITIAAANCADNGHLSGNYAFMFNGADTGNGSRGLNFGQAVGSFIADGNGNISQGYEDTDSLDESVTYTGMTGTYCIGPDNVGSLTFTTASIPDLLITVDSTGNANAVVYAPIYFPSGESFSFGPIVKQDTSAFSAASIVGNYSFGLSGEFFDVGNDGFITGLGNENQAGTFYSDGTGNLTGGELDMNSSAGATLSNVTFSATDLAVAPFGRGTVTLNESGGGTATIIFYIVNAQQLFALAVSPNTVPDRFILSGPIIRNVGAPYSNGSLNGISVLGLQGGSGGAAIAQAGLITWNGSGGFSLSSDENNNGSLSSPGYSGTYSVAANGRVTLTATGQSMPIIYLTGPNQGFVIGTDANVTDGQILPQTGSPFSDASFSGNYLGEMLPTYIYGPPCCSSNTTIDLELDDFTADGSGTLAGTTYLEDLVNGPSINAVSGTYSMSSSGRGTVTQNSSTANIFYVVSPTQVLMIPAAGSYPKVMSLSHP